MKAAVLYIAIFALALLTIPMIAMNFDVEPAEDMQAPAQLHSPPAPQGSEPSSTPTLAVVAGDVEEPVDAGVSAEQEPSQVEAASEPDGLPLTDRAVGSFLILDDTTGEVVEVSLRDFVRGAVAAEMPASFHREALKAQAVAAHTFALHNHLVQQDSPDAALKGADFSADPSKMKVYITEATARDFYGDKADAYWKKICEAADAVADLVLEYEDEPIVAAYHAISAGQTEDASNVWSGNAPYLQPVDSEGDILAPDYESIVTIPTQEMRELLTAAYPEIVLEQDPGDWFEDIVRSPSGYITEIEVGNLTLHGKDIRQLLDLRSHNFEVQYSDRGFEFVVVGYGHGVGLSQYGADYLARQGKSFDEILKLYYTDAVLKRIDIE